MRETTTLKPIRWREDKHRDWMKRAAITAGFITVMFLAGFLFRAAGAAEYSGCHAWIEPGDTLTEISQATGMAIEDLVEVNDNVTNPNLIYAGDSLNVCDFRGEDPGDELAEFFRALEAATLTYTVPVELRDEPAAQTMAPAVVEPQIPAPDEYMIDGILTIHGMAYELAMQGVRGEELRTLTAIGASESLVAGSGLGARQFAIGDSHMENGTWGPSVGFMQVRSLNEQWGTGGPRDEQALRASVSHQAFAAVSVFESQGYNAWTEFSNGRYRSWLDEADEAIALLFPVVH